MPYSSAPRFPPLAYQLQCNPGGILRFLLARLVVRRDELTHDGSRLFWQFWVGVAASRFGKQPKITAAEVDVRRMVSGDPTPKRSCRKWPLTGWRHVLQVYRHVAQALVCNSQFLFARLSEPRLGSRLLPDAHGG